MRAIRGDLTCAFASLSPGRCSENTYAGITYARILLYGLLRKKHDTVREGNRIVFGGRYMSTFFRRARH